MRTVQSGGAGGTGIGIYKALCTPKATIKSCVMLCRRETSFRVIRQNHRWRSAPRGRPSHASLCDRCRRAHVRRCRHRHQFMPTAKSNFGVPGYQPARNSRRAAAFYDANKPGQTFLPPNDLRPESQRRRDLPSMRRDKSSSHNTGRTSCTLTGRRFIRSARRRRCRRRSCCIYAKAATMDGRSATTIPGGTLWCSPRNTAETANGSARVRRKSAP